MLILIAKNLCVLTYQLARLAYNLSYRAYLEFRLKHTYGPLTPKAHALMDKYNSL